MRHPESLSSDHLEPCPCPAKIALANNRKLLPLYLAATNSKSSTRLAPEDEYAKYSSIIFFLETLDRETKHQEDRVVQSSANWISYFTEDRYKRHRRHRVTDLTAVCEAAKEVQKRWDLEKSLDAHFSQVWRRSNAAGTFQAGDILFQDTSCRTINVATNLWFERYYCGHAGGDFIFRRLRERPSPLADLDADAFGARGDPIWPPQLSFEDLVHNECSIDRLEYCGQVPRPPREYARRFAVVCRRVIKVVTCILLFGQRSGLYDENCKFCFLHGMLTSSPSAEDLNRLYHMWDEHYSIGGGPVCAHPPDIILELAFLVTRLGDLVARAVRPLLTVVQRATGQNLHKLAHGYYCCMRKEGLHVLRSGDVSRVLVFEDESVKASFGTARALTRLQLPHGFILFRNPPTPSTRVPCNKVTERWLTFCPSEHPPILPAPAIRVRSSSPACLAGNTSPPHSKLHNVCAALIGPIPQQNPLHRKRHLPRSQRSTPVKNARKRKRGPGDEELSGENGASASEIVLKFD